MLAFEHGYEQGGDSRRNTEGNGYCTGVKTINDLEGRERVTLGISPGIECAFDLGLFMTLNTKTDRHPVDLLACALCVLGLSILPL